MKGQHNIYHNAAQTWMFNQYEEYSADHFLKSHHELVVDLDDVLLKTLHEQMLPSVNTQHSCL